MSSQYRLATRRSTIIAAGSVLLGVTIWLASHVNRLRNESDDPERQAEPAKVGAHGVPVGQGPSPIVPSTSLRVDVLDSGGKRLLQFVDRDGPVADVIVSFDGESSQAHSSRAGRVEVPDNASVARCVHAKYSPTVVAVRDVEGVRVVVLEKAATLTGVVRDQGGRPVPQARVRVERGLGGSMTAMSVRRSILPSDLYETKNGAAYAIDVETDLNGVFHVNGLGAGYHYVSVTKDGYVAHEHDSTRTTLTTVKISMEEGKEIQREFTLCELYYAAVRLSTTTGVPLPGGTGVMFKMPSGLESLAPTQSQVSEELKARLSSTLVRDAATPWMTLTIVRAGRTAVAGMPIEGHVSVALQGQKLVDRRSILYYPVGMVQDGNVCHIDVPLPVMPVKVTVASLLPVALWRTQDGRHVPDIAVQHERVGDNQVFWVLPGTYAIRLRDFFMVPSVELAISVERGRSQHYKFAPGGLCMLRVRVTNEVGQPTRAYMLRIRNNQSVDARFLGSIKGAEFETPCEPGDYTAMLMDGAAEVRKSVEFSVEGGQSKRDITFSF